jgi:hypothetical protein
MHSAADPHPFVRTVERTHAVFALLTAVAAAATAPAWAWGVVGGALLGAFNLRAMAALLGGLLGGQRGERGLATALLPLKFLLLVAAIGGLLLGVDLQPGGLLVGLALLPAALVVGGVWSLRGPGSPADGTTLDIHTPGLDQAREA